LGLASADVGVRVVNHELDGVVWSAFYDGSSDIRHPPDCDCDLACGHCDQHLDLCARQKIPSFFCWAVLCCHFDFCYDDDTFDRDRYGGF
jgi:hypothetical protein